MQEVGIEFFCVALCAAEIFFASRFPRTFIHIHAVAWTTGSLPFREVKFMGLIHRSLMLADEGIGAPPEGERMTRISLQNLQAILARHEIDPRMGVIPLQCILLKWREPRTIQLNDEIPAIGLHNQSHIPTGSLRSIRRRQYLKLRPSLSVQTRISGKYQERDQCEDGRCGNHRFFSRIRSAWSKASVASSRAPVSR